MGRMKTNESRVAAAHSNGVSVRTTIPANVAVMLGLESGNTIKWKVDKDGAGWTAMIRKGTA